MLPQKEGTKVCPPNAPSRSGSGQTTVSNERLIEFRYANALARNVSVAGTFNQWNTQAFRLTKEGMGGWKGLLRLKPGRYQYRFVVDGKWTDDPNAKETVVNELGSRNAVLHVK